MPKSRKTSSTTTPYKIGPIGMNPRLFYGILAALGTVALIFVGFLLVRDVIGIGQPQTQSSPSNQQAFPPFSTPLSVAYSEEAEALFPSLNCLCGTCNDTLAECNCGGAQSMKGYVDSLVESGLSKSEVLDKMVEKYGQRVLAGEGQTPISTPPPATVTPEAGLTTAKSVQRITPAEAKELLDSGSAVLYDVRSAKAYRSKHAAGAISFPEAEVAARFSELPTDKVLIFY